MVIDPILNDHGMTCWKNSIALSYQCQDNKPSLNMEKTKELVIDYKKHDKHTVQGTYNKLGSSGKR